MYFVMEGHAFINEIQTVIQIFYPLEKYNLVSGIQEKGVTIVSVCSGDTCRAAVYRDGVLVCESVEAAVRDVKISVAAILFKTFKKIEKIETPWGMMTGIRPTKKIYELMRSFTKDEVIKIMKETYLIGDDKLKLLFDVIEAQKEMDLNGDVSLYIGIPFCPTKCLYCSFASDTYKANKITPYLNALFKELEFLSDYIGKKRLGSIYIGGGTPTSLEAEDLSRLLYEVNNIFDINRQLEFTVEAGRPDTLDKEKLSILKKYNVNRISINPQTLNLKTLEHIGRKHTDKDFYNAFNLARETGHNNINADIILGLPGETLKDVEYTLSGISELAPESLTVHSLAVKRASGLKEKLDEHSFTPMDEMKKMLKLSEIYAQKMDMRPYYIYRQKNMTGNLENVGYSKIGHECAYNVLIMEETQTILASGAGAVTKYVDDKLNRIERAFNVKNIDEYIMRIDEMIDRKRGIL